MAALAWPKLLAAGEFVSLGEASLQGHQPRTCTAAWRFMARSCTAVQVVEARPTEATKAQGHFSLKQHTGPAKLDGTCLVGMRLGSQPRVPGHFEGSPFNTGCSSDQSRTPLRKLESKK